MTNETSQSVSRSINASAADLFDVLTNPHRHPDFDGSGLIRSVDRADRIQKVGQQFRMNMEGDHMGGEYQTDNIVSGLIDNQLVAWKTAPAGTEPPGWEWLWELKAEGSDSTEVTLTYDWGKVEDKEILKKVTFPLVSTDQMEDSLASLASVIA